MTFLALMLALVLDRLSRLEDWLHRDHWFYALSRQLGAVGLGGSTLVAVSVLIPCLLAHWVLQGLQPVLFGLAWIAASVVLLLYAFGRGSQGADQERYRSQCRRDDFESALNDAATRYNWLSGEEELDAQRIHAVMQRGFLYLGYQRWFAVLFYFLLLGPVGALAYRLLQLACAEQDAGRQLLFYADWVPSRCLAVTFTLAGNFVASADTLWDSLRSTALAPDAMLYQVAVAASDEALVAPADAPFTGQQAALQNESLSALMRRASVCWVAIIALLVVLL